jgi:hypothetical protein
LFKISLMASSQICAWNTYLWNDPQGLEEEWVFHRSDPSARTRRTMHLSKKGLIQLWCGVVQTPPSFSIWLQLKTSMSSQKCSPCGHHTVTS